MNDYDTVYVVDDDKDACASVAALVKSKCGRCESYASAEDFLDSYVPDSPGCLVTDLRLTGINGLDLQEEVYRRDSALPVVLVSGYLNVSNAVRAMKAGAEHVLAKPYRDNDLWDAIECALAHNATARRERTHREGVRARFEKLTPDERNVLELIATGLPNKAVARRLDLGMRTVEERRRRVMDKVGASTFAVLMTKYAEYQTILRDLASSGEGAAAGDGSAAEEVADPA